ncbi:MAG: phosphatidate cytidylyltransferase [SAR324 cluster bacterium]|nr:phosphatidate cytidylyltransferase [SAR324 cluster bacterium]
MNSNMQNADSPSRLGNFLVRLLAAVPVLLLLLAAFLLAPWYVPAAMMGLAGMVGLYEYRALLAGEPGVPLPRMPLLAGGLLIGCGGLFAGARGQTAMFFAAALMWLLLCLLRNRAHHEEGLQQASLGVFGLVWIAWFMDHWILLLRDIPQGNHWAVLLLLVLTGTDVFAYIVGTLLGRHLLIPQISPNKTVEGALGGVAGGLLGGWLALLYFSEGGLGLPLAHVLALCVPLALLGQAGDLAESVLKRIAKVKKSGVFMPGHGGALDRLDSLLLAAPFLYYYLTLVLT